MPTRLLYSPIFYIIACITLNAQGPEIYTYPTPPLAESRGFPQALAVDEDSNDCILSVQLLDGGQRSSHYRENNLPQKLVPLGGSSGRRFVFAEDDGFRRIFLTAPDGSIRTIPFHRDILKNLGDFLEASPELVSPTISPTSLDIVKTPSNNYFLIEHGGGAITMNLFEPGSSTREFTQSLTGRIARFDWAVTGENQLAGLIEQVTVNGNVNTYTILLVEAQVEPNFSFNSQVIATASGTGTSSFSTQNLAIAFDENANPFGSIDLPVRQESILFSIDSGTIATQTVPFGSVALLKSAAYLDANGDPALILSDSSGRSTYRRFRLRGSSWQNLADLDLPDLGTFARLAIGPSNTPHFVYNPEPDDSNELIARSRYLDATDLDNDGQTYLLETALGSNPDDGSDLRLPRALIVNSTSGSVISNVANGYALVAPATWDNNTLGVRLEVEVSRDLKTWVRRPADVDSRLRFFFGQSTVQVVNDNPTTSEDAYQFFRLRASRNN